MVSTTDNHELNKFSQGEDEWDHGDTVDQVEIGAPIRDVESNVGNYTPHDNAWFWATDSDAVYVADGSSWGKVAEFMSREVVRDLVAAFIQGGTDIEVTHDDQADTFTIDWVGSSSGAPTDAEYHVNSAHGSLTNEVVFPVSPGSPTDTQVLAWDEDQQVWAPKDDATSDAGTTSIAEELGTNQNVVYIGDGVSGVIDSSVSTPVQDAINGANSGTYDGGMVLLPPGITQDTGPLSDFHYTSIIGSGTGRVETGSGNAGSVLEITGNNPGMQLTSYSDFVHSYLHNFTLYGGSSRTNHPAIDIQSYGGKNFNMGVMNFQGWGDTDGVIRFSNNGWAWSSKWGSVNARDCAGPIVGLDEQTLSVEIGFMGGELDSGQYAISGSAKDVKGFHVQNMNMGTCQGILDMELWHNADMSIGFANYEPNTDESGGFSTGSGVIRKLGEGSFSLRQLTVNGVSEADGLTVDSGFELGTDAERTWIGFIRSKGGASLTNGKVNVSGSLGTSEPNFYIGNSSDVGNTGNSTTDNLVALGDLTTDYGMA